MTKNEAARTAAQKKRARIQAQALSGELKPREWKVCHYCGECYPWFSPYLQTADAKTCPVWLTGTNCGKSYRKKRSKEAGHLSKGKAKRFKKGRGYCRKELCHKPPFCIHIDRCLDLEIENPGAMPLKKDGSCKVPDKGIANPHRLQAVNYAHVGCAVNKE